MQKDGKSQNPSLRKIAANSSYKQEMWKTGFDYLSVQFPSWYITTVLNLTMLNKFYSYPMFMLKLVCYLTKCETQTCRSIFKCPVSCLHMINVLNLVIVHKFCSYRLIILKLVYSSHRVELKHVCNGTEGELVNHVI